jgi:DNA mismatch repair protein MutS2
MDERDFRVLELPKVLELLAEKAAFSASKELALGLNPAIRLEVVHTRQAETTEARLLLSLQSNLTIGGVTDVRIRVEAATRGAILEPHELLDLKGTLIAARNHSRFFAQNQSQYPCLAQITGPIIPLPDLIEKLEKSITEHGEIPDSASENLGTIRRDLRVAKERLSSKLQKLISDPGTIRMLQEPIITQREGRYVIPLRSEFKGQLRSVIHDQSASGATLFVEPLTVVDSNNEVRELELQERDEVRRILAQLSSEVGEQEETINLTVKALAELDLAFAKAHLAESMESNEPLLFSLQAETAPNPSAQSLQLIAAKHPLLDQEQVVPIDIALDEGTKALVITGPNTGGKTVALKTCGLIVLMAQCGMHIPAKSGSCLPIFSGVYADIGDEQSIEQSLSTFSGHISNIVRILGMADDRSLVLLDELGAGTDPQEGASLARALLSSLVERGSTTLVATHYPELKLYAHNQPGVRNASVEFDLVSLKPTYELTIGLPGRSNAFAIAERLGLDNQILEQARTSISADDLSAENLLEEIRQQRDAAEKARQDAERLQEEAQAEEELLKERLESIEEERIRILEEGKLEAKRELDEFQEQLASLRRQMAKAAQPLEALERLDVEIEQIEDETFEPVQRKISIEQPQDPVERQFSLGDKVRLDTIDTQGVITSLGVDYAEVQVGRLRVRARLAELSKPGKEEPEQPPKTGRAKRKDKLTSSQSIKEAPPLELHLRGLTVDEAIEKLERRLDAAYLSGVPFLRIVHGKGTGRLRDAVRQALRDNPYVESFKPGQSGEGGEGVTVVRINIG